MSDASLSDWLRLRQAADHAARSTTLTTLIAEALGPGRPLRILDLGTGTGSNIRYLAPRLGGAQDWLAVDKDAALLTEAAERSQSIAPDVHVATRALDLGSLAAADIFDGRRLVTASALLDLVSERWLRWVAQQCRRVSAAALFTITYSGRNACDPVDPDDQHVFALFNRHQLTDKGLGGPACGPAGTEAAARCFTDEGYEVRIEPSDWKIGSGAREFQRQLIDGWAVAATEMAPQEASAIAAWQQRRVAHVAAGRSRVVVGHHDLAAITA